MTVLSQRAFARRTIPGKEGLKFRKILSSEEANMVLDIIWKESDYVPETSIIMAGFQGKTFSGSVRCYSLGVLLANDKNDVAATVTRVRNIVIAACAYGLVSRDQVNFKNTPVQCESLLNEIMLELGMLNGDSGQKFAVQVGWAFLQLREQARALHTGRS